MNAYWSGGVLLLMLGPSLAAAQSAQAQADLGLVKVLPIAMADETERSRELLSLRDLLRQAPNEVQEPRQPHRLSPAELHNLREQLRHHSRQQVGHDKP
ncbi:hypothetical protein [Hydrogenophaga sp.]|uniref:hypothetical protein n=1 Tax=Hydrogenophaga sp. TaxID=1904254 RepID=UPI0019C54297|nr:hypothetical protein [Hydrogenophaga sp.]MBD3892503.1 hypothetical protein [Hydrogenophaga sp.]